MVLPQPAPRFERQDFLVWESEQEIKHEYVAGEVFAQAGARQVHVLVAGNCYAALHQRLRGSPCRPYIADMQLEVERADAVYYPDVMVSCHPEDLAADRVLHHPRVIIEVLSDSTAAYDRGQKFAAYRLLDSLQEYVLVDADRRSLEIFRRLPSGDWLLATHDSARALVLASLELEIGLDEVFEGLDREPVTASTGSPS
ncbi:Uma2 family endonuclease [Thauera sp. Sel9]|uniref:Uma2 family endonuclease n=1 Tax=Thauera sp. Sel9 TaxID=2974299 RepID=UPI0021E186F4|nr:Uma2 family endonuclease [Thauera sp. Sel9]MCV2219892.1 Uma2 family endonuclease [Thauera sp. Sel9]